MSGPQRGGLPPCGFLVSATSAGQIPISVEKRAKGKKVTIVANVQGNARALCTALTTLLGVGGTIHDRGPKAADVEVQGEQVERVSTALGQLGCLRGLPRSRERAAVVVERNSAYDDFLDAPRERKPRHAQPVLLEPPPLDAACRQWHGDWLYCRGRCEKIDFNDIWNERETPLIKRCPNPATSSNVLAALNRWLRNLGMLAEPGEAVLEWHVERKLLEEEVALKRAAPKPSMCSAPSVSAVEGHYACKECGAVFSLKRTLQKHIQQHESDRQAVSAAARIGDSAGSSWRRSSFEETAAFEAYEESLNHETLAALLEEDELSEYQAPRDCSSLGSWISVAVDKRHRGKRGGKKAAIPTDKTVCAAVQCPICTVFFPKSEIERHVEACLAVPPPQDRQHATSEPAVASSKSAVEGGQLPEELLESLLDLDLSEVSAARFWDHYEEALREGLKQDEAFLAALGQTIEEDDEGNAASSNIQHDVSATSTSTCPVCGRLFTAAAIEHHVEACLSNSSINREVHPRPCTNSIETRSKTADDVQGCDAEYGFSTVESKRSRRWDSSLRAGNIKTSAHSDKRASKPTLRSKPTPNATPPRPPADRHQSSGPVHAPAQTPLAPSVSLAQQAVQVGPSPIQVAQEELQLIDWLQHALKPLLNGDALEAVVASVQVVLECEEDAESAENAAALLAAELPPGSVSGDEVLSEFKRRLAMRT